MYGSTYGVLPGAQGIVPGVGVGGIVPGVGTSGVYGGGIVGAPIGASGVYGGAPVATTNQFYTQAYDQNLFNLLSC